MKFKLIEEWKTVALNSATTWTSAGVGAVIGLIAAKWMVILSVLPFLPFWLRMPIAVVVGSIAVAGPTVWARVTEQPKLQAKVAAKQEAKHGSA